MEGLKKRHYNPEFDIEEWFYKDKEGNIFPYWKEDIQRYIDPHKPSTFLFLLEELNIPFIELEWIRLLEKAYNSCNITQSIQNVFGRYLALMKLKGYRSYRFEDTVIFIGQSVDIFDYYASVIYIPTTQIAITKADES